MLDSIYIDSLGWAVLCALMHPSFPSSQVRFLLLYLAGVGGGECMCHTCADVPVQVCGVRVCAPNPYSTPAWSRSCSCIVGFWRPAQVCVRDAERCQNVFFSNLVFFLCLHKTCHLDANFVWFSVLIVSFLFFFFDVLLS